MFVTKVCTEPLGTAVTHVWLYTAQGVGQCCQHRSSPWLPNVVLAAGLEPVCAVPQVLPASERALGPAMPSPVLRWLSGSSPALPALRGKGLLWNHPQAHGKEC